MNDDPLLARLDAALREAEHLRLEALRVQREAAVRLAEIRWSGMGLSEAMDRSLALRLGPRPARPGGETAPTRSAIPAGLLPHA